MATIEPNGDFDAAAAAEELNEAMSGRGTDEEAIIGVLTRNSNLQRQQLKLAFEDAYGDNLVDKLKREFGANMENLVEAVMAPVRVYDSRELRGAMRGPGTVEDILIEIMCSRPNDVKEDIRTAYSIEFERDLETDFQRETTGTFTNLLVSELGANRDEGTDVDEGLAEEDARNIYEAGEDQLGTDESVFNEVLCSRSYAQLQQTFRAYEGVAGDDIEEAIRRETSGPTQDGYLAIVKRAKNCSRFFAERLRESMKGVGTDEDSLIRLVVSRTEIDLKLINAEFSDMYGDTLQDAIDGECRGDIKKMLLALVDGNM